MTERHLLCGVEHGLWLYPAVSVMRLNPAQSS
uniref:Uncharacterized protein n=1 Tax=Anguilla anguilla TaxID=7936 RepID=A0A0E9UY36_ANGAN